MASIKDSIDEALAEKYSYIKYLLLAIPICASYELFKQGNMDAFYFVCGLTTLIVATALVKVIYNTSNNQSNLLTIFNVADFTFSIAKFTVSVLPVAVLMGYLGYRLTGLSLPFDFPNIQTIYSIVIWSLVGSVILTSTINYGRKEQIGDAYNVVILGKHSLDVLIAIVFLLPQIALFNAILIGVLVYLFGIFYNTDNIIFVYFCSVVISFNVVILGNYLSQIGYETIERKDIEEKDHDIT